MKMGMIGRRIIDFFKIDWINTIRFNFKYFEPRIALIFPCFLYNSKIIALDGKVELISHPRTGMVKFGKTMVPINRDYVGFVYENRGGTLKLGKGEIGSGSAVSIQKGSLLILENNFHATSRAKIVCACEIAIGKSSRIGWDCLIMDTDWHSIYNFGTKTLSPKMGKIHIGDFLWLANGVTVMKESVIPNYSIVAGKSLVNRPLDNDYSLYAGTPAKLIKTGIVRDEFANNLD